MARYELRINCDSLFAYAVLKNGKDVLFESNDKKKTELRLSQYKAEKPTIYDVKYLTAGKQPFFFSRKTMAFFCQTLRDYSVCRTDDPRVFCISALMYARGQLKAVGVTSRYFAIDDLFDSKEEAVAYADEKEGA
jgi:hypothetical protein